MDNNTFEIIEKIGIVVGVIILEVIWLINIWFSGSGRHEVPPALTRIPAPPKPYRYNPKITNAR